MDNKQIKIYQKLLVNIKNEFRETIDFIEDNLKECENENIPVGEIYYVVTLCYFVSSRMIDSLIIFSCFSCFILESKQMRY